MEPSVANEGRLDPRLSVGTREKTRTTRVQQQSETPLLSQPYMPYPSNVSSTGSRRKPANLSDVVSSSGDTTDLARNLGSYLNTKIPPSLSICVLIVLSVAAFALILMGTFHIPFCHVQPMIPIWLTVAGVLFIMTATLRIFRMIPSPRGGHRSQSKSLDLCCRISEGLLVVVNIVWLTLGCIWVYGSKPYVHFEEHMFEEHYCDRALYWVAFWTCTLYLVMICIMIILLIILMAVLSTKEAAENEIEP
ncbi:hypothetical protein V3C99_011647 [Haemonchus contortus]|uniref:Conserved plasma membrane protein n=1 Tax=Haemonchus contortus TaxID=6289 RepID=A0A7I4Y773_HAECO|nr:hypothetical protein LOC100699880 [Haemonchus contortus]